MRVRQAAGRASQPCVSCKNPHCPLVPESSLRDVYRAFVHRDFPALLFSRRILEPRAHEKFFCPRTKKLFLPIRALPITQCPPNVQSHKGGVFVHLFFNSPYTLEPDTPKTFNGRETETTLNGCFSDRTCSKNSLRKMLIVSFHHQRPRGVATAASVPVPLYWIEPKGSFSSMDTMAKRHKLLAFSDGTHSKIYMQTFHRYAPSAVAKPRAVRVLHADPS